MDKRPGEMSAAADTAEINATTPLALTIDGIIKLAWQSSTEKFSIICDH